MGSLAQFLEGGAFGVLNDILSTFHSEEGYAVPNRFECLILPPISGNSSSFSSGPLQGDARAISMRCESASMPGRNLNSVEDSNIYGPVREVVTGVSYAGDIEMLFQASSGLQERVFFESWQEKAFNPSTWDVGYHEDYVSEVQLYLLDRQDQRRYGVRLHEVFPKSIGAVGLNQAPSSEIIKIPVTFSFRWGETLDITRQAPSLGEKIFSTVVDTVERNITRNIPRVLTRL